MPITQVNINSLRGISILLENSPNNIAPVLLQFQQLIGMIHNTPFSVTNWTRDFRKEVWIFAGVFKNISPVDFVAFLDTSINNNFTLNEELLHFFKSELLISFSGYANHGAYFESLAKQYPFNSEFRHTYGHYQKEILNDLDGAHKSYIEALKIDPDNIYYTASKFGLERFKASYLLENGQLEEGLKYIELLINKREYYESKYESHASFLEVQSRYKDHLSFIKRIKQFETDIENKIQDERKRVIEILGFFCTILAFILSTVTIAQRFSFIEASCFLLLLASVLLIFAITISLLFNRGKKSYFLEDYRFWLIILGLGGVTTFVLIVIKYSEIVNYLKE